MIESGIMNINEERERFLAEQAQEFGEPILSFALGKVLSGPALGSELVFLLVGTAALHLLPTTREPSVFGIPLGLKKGKSEPEPLNLPRDRILSYGVLKPKGIWAVLTAPHEVVEVAAHTELGTDTWRFQLVGESEAFLSHWKTCWTPSADLSLP